jgi:hypothetical protein
MTLFTLDCTSSSAAWMITPSNVVVPHGVSLQTRGMRIVIRCLLCSCGECIYRQCKVVASVIDRVMDVEAVA